MHAVYLTVASLIEPEAATAGSVRAIVREEVAVVVEILNCDRFAKEKSLGLVKIPLTDMVVRVEVGGDEGGGTGLVFC